MGEKKSNLSQLSSVCLCESVSCDADADVTRASGREGPSEVDDDKGSIFSNDPHVPWVRLRAKAASGLS